MVNVILCGGSGTRLWPLSREMMPKQFVKLFNNKSLFQETILRNQKFCDKFIAVTNENHFFLMHDQKMEVDFNKPLKTIIEPIGKNTAPAIAFAAMMVDPEEILFITPSDHKIKEDEAYKEAINRARKLAACGYIVTFGLKALEPVTGYGYIEANGEDVYRFHEKPDYETALEYVRLNKIDTKKRFYWNLGMFVFQAKIYLKELQKYAPEIYETAKQAYDNSIEIDSHKKIKTSFMEKIPEESIDYAVAEHTERIKMVPVSFHWSDVGSFDTLSQEIDSTSAVEVSSSGNFVIAQKEVVLIGLEDLIVVDTSDALLIIKKGLSQKVKEALKQIKDKKLLKYHTQVYRPWGSYEVLINEKGYKIKRIIVKPGKRLSLQKHFHRNEHWIVVSGTAEVQVGKQTYLVRPNESTYIKMGEIHRLSNPGKVPVILIEAQVGEYLEEDDIVRLEDDFKRDAI